MPVAQPQRADEGLSPDAHRVMLAGSIEGLRYPELCPNCGEGAADPLPVAKVFTYPRSGRFGGHGWGRRIAQATPLFCHRCYEKHRSEALPVTGMERLKSVVLSELAFPALGSAAFAVFLLHDQAGTLMRDFSRQWPMLAFIGGLLLIAVLCLRTAWVNNAYRRVPTQTQTSRAFDFGDNGDTAFQTTARTYAIRNGACAAALERLNAECSAELLGPAQRRRESWNFCVMAVIIAALAIAGHYAKVR
jgi:hypothetical protein